MPNHSFYIALGKKSGIRVELGDDVDSVGIIPWATKPKRRDQRVRRGYRGFMDLQRRMRSIAGDDAGDACFGIFVSSLVDHLSFLRREHEKMVEQSIAARQRQKKRRRLRA